MNKINGIILFLSLILFLSGCSQSYRSNAHYQHDIQQKQAVALQRQYQKQQIYGSGHSQYSKQVSYKKKPQKLSLMPQGNTTHASQQAHSNAVLNQHHARQLISRMAHSTIGAPYKWGGNNPRQGFDCSGLMSYVHKNALGINIPRTAAQQRDQSRTVRYEELQPGDMLFFKTGKNANHVGVYIGNRKFIHAATGSKHVKVASMDSAYWHKRFVKFGSFL